MDDPRTLVEELSAISRRSQTLTGRDLAECLETRRRLIEQLSSSEIIDTDLHRLRDAAELGRQLRIRILVETAHIRQEMQDLEAVRRGLGRFRPANETSRKIDVRI